MPNGESEPLFNDAQLDSAGVPASGAKLFTYAAGSTTTGTVGEKSPSRKSSLRR